MITTVKGGEAAGEEGREKKERGGKVGKNLEAHVLWCILELFVVAGFLTISHGNKTLFA